MPKGLPGKIANPSRSKNEKWLAPALPLVVAAAVAIAFWAVTYDDAHITYRCAANLAGRGEFTFNPGETVLGTTAPGWALLLGALVHCTGIEAAAWGTMLGLASILAVGWALRTALKNDRLIWGAASPALAVLAALVWRWNIELLGGEVLPQMAAVVWAIVLSVNRKHEGLSGILAGLAVALRPDGALPALLLGISPLAKRRTLPWACLPGLAPAPTRASLPPPQWLSGCPSGRQAQRPRGIPCGEHHSVIPQTALF